MAHASGRRSLASASVSISAGIRGLQILLAPADYLRVRGARLGAIATAD
jgi:hypothetical protein